MAEMAWINNKAILGFLKLLVLFNDDFEACNLPSEDLLHINL